MKFPLLALFLLFLAWLNYNRMKVLRKEKDSDKKFWKKEEEANMVRKKDISGLPYIQLSLDMLPFGAVPGDTALCDCEERIRTLSGEKILNLSGMTNTEVKFTYGAPNLPFLSRCDQNYASLLQLLQEWGKRLHELSLSTEAIQVLELAVSLGSDIKATYVLLSSLYLETGQPQKLQELKDRANQLHSLMKEPILNHLNGL